MATSAIKKLTSTGAGDVIKMLPSGTVFLYQFLGPLLANDSGKCNPSNKVLVIVLAIICALFCILSSFTDSYVGPDGTVNWIIVFCGCMWPTPQSVDLSAYKYRNGDGAHAVLSLIVFVVLVVTDSNMVKCLFPRWALDHKLLFQILPLAVGLASSGVFYWFPNTRHGIGYRCTATTTGVQTQLPPTNIALVSLPDRQPPPS